MVAVRQERSLVSEFKLQHRSNSMQKIVGYLEDHCGLPCPIEDIIRHAAATHSFYHIGVIDDCEIQNMRMQISDCRGFLGVNCPFSIYVLYNTNSYLLLPTQDQHAWVQLPIPFAEDNEQLTQFLQYMHQGEVITTTMIKNRLKQSEQLALHLLYQTFKANPGSFVTHEEMIQYLLATSEVDDIIPSQFNLLYTTMSGLRREIATAPYLTLVTKQATGYQLIERSQ